MSKVKVYFTKTETLGATVDELKKFCDIVEPNTSVPVHMKDDVYNLELDVHVSIEQLEDAFENTGYLESNVVGINNKHGTFLSKDDINGIYITDSFHLKFSDGLLTAEYGASHSDDKNQWEFE